jgi:hypothetical protein|tara:strand:+ start:108 stop:374 length:267 start_codon:yes stop_codon:yes gene_type:complete
MWTKVKNFFKKSPPLPKHDLIALTMLQQIIKAHKQGKVVFSDCTPQEQTAKILNKAQFLGVEGDSVPTVDKNIKKILANNALGRAVHR